MAKLQKAYKIRHISSRRFFSGVIKDTLFNQINAHLSGDSRVPELKGFAKKGRLFNDMRWPRVIFNSISEEHRSKFELVLLKEVVVKNPK